METNEDLNKERTNYNVIFMDFDGVINSYKFIIDYIANFKSPTEKTYYITEHIDPAAIERVNKIVKALNAKVVISSAWRKSFNLDSLREILESKGFVGEIIGETKVLDVDRGHEIQLWLDENGVSPEKILILDDLDTMAHLSYRQILTSFDDGLLDSHIDDAMRLFE